MKAWEAHRLDLLNDAKKRLDKNKINEILNEIIKNLSCTDPEKIDNYPHDTPYIEEHVLEE